MAKFNDAVFMNIYSTLALMLNIVEFAMCCIPSFSKTGLIIGQDFGSILNYTSAFPSSSSSDPFGFMVYTALNGTSGELAGLKYPIDYGSGVEWMSGLISIYPQSAIQIGLYLVDQLDIVAAGQFDVIILRLAEYVKENSGHVFYLRIGYEFDFQYNHYDGATYIAAFRRIVTIMKTADVTNVLFVWHGTGEQPWGDNLLGYNNWFPGTEYVDMCGVSIFQQPYRCEDPADCRMEHVENLLNYCQALNITSMIAESTPFGGIITDEDLRRDPLVKNRAGFAGTAWARWFTPVLALIEKHDIRIWSYINNDWDSFPMWQREHAPNIFWGDSRVEAYNETFEHWLNEVLHSSRFLISAIDVNQNPALCETRSADVLFDGSSRVNTADDKSIRQVITYSGFCLFGVVLLCVLIWSARFICLAFRRFGYQKIPETEEILNN